jgi:hypothetical protein
MFKVEDPVVKTTDGEEMVLFTVTIFELVEDAEDTSDELTEDIVEMVEETSLEVLDVVVASPLEVLEISLDVVDGATLLLLLELLGASLILRAPLIPLLTVGLPSFFFM